MSKALPKSEKFQGAGVPVNLTGRPFIQIVSLALLLAFLIGVSGCGSGGSLAGPTVIVYPNITGNWQIQTSAGNPTLGVLLVGYLSETDSVVTGTLQFTNLVPGNSCGSAPYIVAVSGGVTPDGKLTLGTAVGMNGPTVQSNLQLSPGAYNYAYGRVTVTGPGPCVYPSTNALGAHIGTVTGKYTGAPTLAGAISGVGISSAALTLTQAPTPNADGSFLVSGNLAFGGAACSVTLPVQGSILGVGLSLTSALSSSSPTQPEVTISSTVSSDQSQLYDASFIFNSGQCTSSSSGFAKYQGSLKRVN